MLKICLFRAAFFIHRIVSQKGLGGYFLDIDWILTANFIGVAGLISPWNLPLYLLTWKIAPAIAFGNTCVAKPSEITSLTAYELCKIMKQVENEILVKNFYLIWYFIKLLWNNIKMKLIILKHYIYLYSIWKIYSKADLPDGVVNIVYGTGPKAGEALVTHPDVPLVSYFIH